MATNVPECTISTPGYFYRDNCTLLCRPSAWTDVAVFFLGNYVAHVATVNSRPGQSAAETILISLTALLFPGTGITAALDAVFSLAIFAPTELQMAARARALFMVIPPQPGTGSSRILATNLQAADVGPSTHLESPQAPRRQDIELGPVVESSQRGEVVNRDATQDEDQGLISNKKGPLPAVIHGVWQLPEGYSFLLLDRRARFENDQEGQMRPFWSRIWRNAKELVIPKRSVRASISCNYNIARIVTALVQLAYSIVTLYRTRGDQITMYGYAAFGLTVSQYAWVSLLNLMGSLIRPHYPSMFVVDSNTLRDLRTKLAAQGKSEEFLMDGTVGQLTAKAEEDVLQDLVEGSAAEDEAEDRLGGKVAALNALSWLSLAIPIAVIGGLSHFSPGASAPYQRVWTMVWLVFGFLFGSALGGLRTMDPRNDWVVSLAFSLTTILVILLLSAPAFGGFVVVGQMIMEYGVCVRVS